MDFTAVVLYKGALTHYTVKMQVNGTYEAGLLKYTGEVQNCPPLNICFTKEGRHCIGDINDQDLLDDIYHAVKSKQEKGGLLKPGSNPGIPYVEI
jgi:hypothetical protein